MITALPAAEALDIFLGHHPELVPPAAATLVLRAEYQPFLARFPAAGLACQQTFKPKADLLVDRGFALVRADERPLDLAILLATKHKEENLFLLAQAANRLREGGAAVCACANDTGAASLEKRFSELFGGVESFCKRKCRVFSARKSERLDRELLGEWLGKGEWQKIPGTELVGRPGIFSWQKIDPGSALLAGHLPADLSGRGADLGAGYGYLSHALLRRGQQRIEALHLFEAEALALEAAERNLATWAGATRLHYHWHDVTAGLPANHFHWIVMNPPFHSGREVDFALGQQFIEAAAAGLRPGGRLFLVANRQLPYEQQLRRQFRKIATLAEEQGFKVIMAEK